MATVSKITPCLWFDDRGEEAANFYVNIFKNSRVKEIVRYPADSPGPEGSVMLVLFELDGHEFTALNGGPQFTFDEAVSFEVRCKDQAEIDYFWDRLTEDGGQESVCGWVKDKFGLSWQVVPEGLYEMASDPAKFARAAKAVWGMKKIDIAEIERAANGS
jgi:predicted 3-demethylubiquinone-9 3-methyltransferase (glyoxalase superfamily)